MQAQTRPDRAQRTQGKISGRVLERDTQRAVPSATVALWTASDSSLVTGTITQPDGSFVLEGLRPGKYDVHVSFVGFVKTVVSDIEISRGNLAPELAAIELEADTQMMDEVEIAADRNFVEVGIDRTTYNTKDQLVSAGGSATDVLENIPSVEVDIEGNISLRGSQNVAILINGRPAPMSGEALVSYLQGLPAEVVDKVEVIPNPSAKFEPDGMAGILNIELKKNQDLGLSGSFTANASTPDRYGASGNIGYQKGKLGLFAGYGARYGSRDSEGWRFSENRISDPISLLDQESFDSRSSLSHNANASIDYKIGRLSNLNLSTSFSTRSGDEDGLTSYFELDNLSALTERYDRSTLGDRSDVEMEYRLAFKRIVEPGKNELDIELEFEQEKEEDTGTYNQMVFDLADLSQSALSEQQSDLQKDNNQEGSLRIDYMRTFGESGKMEVGFKGDLERQDSEFFTEDLDMGTGLLIPNLNRNNTFIYDQTILASYGILGAKIGRFGLQAGVRLEQAFTTFELENTNESFDNNYFSVFPSAFAVYEFTETRSLKLAYSKRIQRPRTGGRFNMLNPFNSSEDPLFIRQGNPFLEPEYIHAFELSYTQFTDATSLTLTPYFRHTVNEISFFQRFRDDGVSVLTFENFDSSNSWGTEIIGTYKQGRKLNAYASFNVYRVVTDGSSVDTGLSNKAIGFSSRANATYTMNTGMALQFSYYYRAPMNIENGRMASRQSADLALRQKLMGDRANLSLRIRDVFNTMGFHVLREDTRSFQEIDRSFQSQSIGLSFTYNFGKKDNRRRQNSSRGGEGDFEGLEMQ
ncbi:MAG: TonB-dependent receptor [Bacteroidota bacterium]